MEHLKYPIGKYDPPPVFTPELMAAYITTIATFPAKIKQEVIHLTDEQLDTPYRPGGWSVRQVVNHCADSHTNAFIRHKLALTEEKPVITPYMQDLWAYLPDSQHMPIAPALSIIEGIHNRWVVLLNALHEEQWLRSFIHPEYEKEITLKESAGNYAWHCEHHLAHITELKKRMDWM